MMTDLLIRSPITGFVSSQNFIISSQSAQNPAHSFLQYNDEASKSVIIQILFSSSSPRSETGSHYPNLYVLCMLSGA